MQRPYYHKPLTPTLWKKISWKFIFTTLGVSTALLAPPLESMPSFLLPYRITLEGIVRALRLGLVGCLAVFEYQVFMNPKSASQDLWDNAHTKTAMRLVRVAEKNGGLYIKAGQGFAAASDVLPPVYCKILRKLQDSVEPRPFSQVRAVLRAEFGSDEKIEELFEEIDEQAIAAASLAQVHRGRLNRKKFPPPTSTMGPKIVKKLVINKSTGDPEEIEIDLHEEEQKGQEVAIKCQYFDVRQRYNSDLHVIVLALKISGWFFPGFDFGPFIKQCEETLHKELDFKTESVNLKRCQKDFDKKFKNGEIICPKVFDEVSGDMILVTEFIHGVRAGEHLKIEKLGLSTKEVGTTLSDAFAYQLFETGFAHADPHGGNILVRPHPQNPKRAQCILLDHGLSYEIPDKERRQLADLWTFSATHNTPRLKKLMKEELGMNPDSYDMLASMFLQFPYESFNAQRQFATIEEIEKLRNAYNDPAMTELLQKFPTSFLLAISSISLYRAVHKQLGNPVSRPNRMLRYSLPNGSDAKSHEYHDFSDEYSNVVSKVLIGLPRKMTWMASNYVWVQWALFRQWFFEKANSTAIQLAFWWDPKLKEAVPDELLQLA